VRRTLALTAALLLLTAVPVAAVQPPSGRFNDDDGIRAEGFAEVLASRGVVTGCTSDGTRFCPDATLSRGQMASFLARALGLPRAARDHFSDDNGTTHESAINSLAEAGIVVGRSSSAFGPSAQVSRGQVASMLVAAFDLPPAQGDRFSDDNGSVHEANINAGRTAFVLEPCRTGPSSYCPQDLLLRGDMAIFTAKALGLPPVPPIRAGRLADLPEPLVFAHRGGFAHGAENTMELFRAVVAQGTRALELDAHVLADGSLGVMHDDTVDRTTTSTGATASRNATSFRQLVIDHAGQRLHPPLLQDVLAEFGNRVFLVIEAKNAGAGAAIAQLLSQAGVHPDAAMVSAGDQRELAPVTSAGYHTMAIGDALSGSSLRQSGVDFAAVTTGVSQSTVDGLRAAGLRVAVRGVTSRDVRDRFLAFGVDGVIADDPLLLAR
jgi:glycerophosphoryl diester phosphodiesterase